MGWVRGLDLVFTNLSSCFGYALPLTRVGSGVNVSLSKILMKSIIAPKKISIGPNQYFPIFPNHVQQ